jgi:hypothetical protein
MSESWNRTGGGGFCTQCGSPSTSGQRFCPICGASVLNDESAAPSGWSPITTPPTELGPSSPPAGPERSGSSKGRTILILGVLVGVALVSVATALFEKKGADNSIVSVPRLTPSSPAPQPKPAVDLHNIDFANIDVPGSLCGARNSIRLHNGAAIIASTRWPDYPQVHTSITGRAVYGDLEGDGNPEAGISMSCDNGGGTVVGRLAQGWIIFSGDDGTVRVRGIITPQQPPDKSVLPPFVGSISFGPDGIVSTETWFAAADLDCCPSIQAITVWVDRGGTLVPDKPQVIASGQPAHTQYNTLQAGDCYNRIGSNSIFSGEVDKVNCSAAHDTEVTGSFEASATGGYPATAGFRTQAEPQCTTLGNDYLGNNSGTGLRVVWLAPNQATWDSGTHTVICGVQNSDGSRHTGSVRG